jgi:hypothetical protein
MTKDEALKLALEALEELNETNSYWWMDVEEETVAKIEPAITAIKEALAQPEQERNFCPRCGKRTADLTVIHTCTPSQEST